MFAIKKNLTFLSTKYGQKLKAVKKQPQKTFAADVKTIFWVAPNFQESVALMQTNIFLKMALDVNFIVKETLYEHCFYKAHNTQLWITSIYEKIRSFLQKSAISTKLLWILLYNLNAVMTLHFVRNKLLIILDNGVCILNNSQPSIIVSKIILSYSFAYNGSWSFYKFIEYFYNNFRGRGKTCHFQQDTLYKQI